MDQSQKECKLHGNLSCYICSIGEMSASTSTQADVVEVKKHRNWPCAGEVMMIMSMITMALTVCIPVIIAWKIVFSGVALTFVLMYFGSKIHEAHKPREGETDRVIID